MRLGRLLQALTAGRVARSRWVDKGKVRKRTGNGYGPWLMGKRSPVAGVARLSFVTGVA